MSYCQSMAQLQSCAKIMPNETFAAQSLRFHIFSFFLFPFFRAFTFFPFSFFLFPFSFFPLFSFSFFLSSSSEAAEPYQLVREGIALYAHDKFDEAREKFAEAEEKAKTQNSPNATIIAFDLACAHHRKGDTEKARDSYLQAGLSRDPRIAAESHFNLGCLSAESARALAGEHPENLAQEKRQEVIDKLKESVAYLRHCLDRQPAHAGAKKNIEAIRLWIKCYIDKWRAADRQKMRQETNLLQFLEHLINTENLLRSTVKELNQTASPDIFAELKQSQDELIEEIEPLKDKIKEALTLPASPPSAPTNPSAPAPASPEIERGIKILQTWADAAREKMRAASEKLNARQPSLVSEEQRQAIHEMNNIWQAVAPFQALLARALSEQTAIVQTLKPDLNEAAQNLKEKWQGSLFNQLLFKGQDLASKLLPSPTSKKNGESSANANANASSANQQDARNIQTSTLNNEQFSELAQLQEDALQRADLLKPKADAELKRLMEMPSPPPSPAPQAVSPKPKHSANNGQDKTQAPQQPDPEKIKEGLRKAIELAPRAVEKMRGAVDALRGKKPDLALPDAEEAKRILDEIAKAQPKNEQQQKQDQDKDKKEQNKDEQNKQDEKKKEQEKKDEKEENKPEEKKQFSQDQVEDILRKAREREKIKRDRERELKARVLGQQPVEKDW